MSRLPVPNLRMLLRPQVRRPSPLLCRILSLRHLKPLPSARTIPTLELVMTNLITVVLRSPQTSPHRHLLQRLRRPISPSPFRPQHPSSPRKRARQVLRNQLLPMLPAPAIQHLSVTRALDRHHLPPPCRLLPARVSPRLPPVYLLDSISTRPTHHRLPMRPVSRLNTTLVS
jgi:hypothetical protein